MKRRDFLDDLFEAVTLDLFRGRRRPRGYRPTDEATEPTSPPSAPAGISRPEPAPEAQESLDAAPRRRRRRDKDK